MKLVPKESPLRRVPRSVDRRTVLYLDGVRYALQSFELSSLRLARTLHHISKKRVDTDDLGHLILEATVDAWTMVDSTHRLRELLLQIPGLKKNEAELQLFIRKTKSIEELRHFFQHFRSEIGSFADRGMPLWGTIAWASEDPDSGLPNTHTIIPGTFFEGEWAGSCTFDFKTGKFVERVVLHAGPKRVDLADLSETVERFVGWYVQWFERTFRDEDRLGADVHMQFTIKPVPHPEDGATR